MIIARWARTVTVNVNQKNGPMFLSGTPSLRGRILGQITEICQLRTENYHA